MPSQFHDHLIEGPDDQSPMSSYPSVPVEEGLIGSYPTLTHGVVVGEGKPVHLPHEHKITSYVLSKPRHLYHYNQEVRHKPDITDPQIYNSTHRRQKTLPQILFKVFCQFRININKIYYTEPRHSYGIPTPS